MPRLLPLSEITVHITVNETPPPSLALSTGPDSQRSPETSTHLPAPSSAPRNLRLRWRQHPGLHQCCGHHRLPLRPSRPAPRTSAAAPHRQINSKNADQERWCFLHQRLHLTWRCDDVREGASPPPLRRPPSRICRGPPWIAGDR